MKRLILTLLAFLLLAAGCVTDLPADPLGVTEQYEFEPGDPVETTTTTTEPDAGPQLITERWLRRGLDMHTIQTIDEPVAQFLFDQHVEVLGSGLAHDWDRHPTGWILARPQHIVGTPFKIIVEFGGPTYAAGDGTVTETNCRNLPGGGVATTGDYSTVSNETDSPIEHEINDTTTESESQTNSLAQSLELSTGESFEAGVNFGGAEAKTTLDFTQTFGLNTESIAESASSSEHSVKDLTEVAGNTTVNFADTLNSSRTACDLKIRSTGDWGGLAIIPPVDRPFTGDTFCSGSSLYAGQVGRDYGHGHNGSILRRSDLFHGSGCRIELDSADGLVRLLRGTDVRCPNCDQLEFNDLAERAIVWFGLQKSRHISFDGRRISAVHKDASYKAYDTTGYDQGCVDDVLDDVGTPITDDLLDGCQP